MAEVNVKVSGHGVFTFIPKSLGMTLAEVREQLEEEYHLSQFVKFYHFSRNCGVTNGKIWASRIEDYKEHQTILKDSIMLHRKEDEAHNYLLINF